MIKAQPTHSINGRVGRFFPISLTISHPDFPTQTPSWTEFPNSHSHSRGFHLHLWLKSWPGNSPPNSQSFNRHQFYWFSHSHFSSSRFKSTPCWPSFASHSKNDLQYCHLQMFTRFHSEFSLVLLNRTPLKIRWLIWLFLIIFLHWISSTAPRITSRRSPSSTNNSNIIAALIPFCTANLVSSKKPAQKVFISTNSDRFEWFSSEKSFCQVFNRIGNPWNRWYWHVFNRGFKLTFLIIRKRGIRLFKESSSQIGWNWIFKKKLQYWGFDCSLPSWDGEETKWLGTNCHFFAFERSWIFHRNNL
jgi:hypothetical protein